jgi:hypothetical protein
MQCRTERRLRILNFTIFLRRSRLRRSQTCRLNASLLGRRLVNITAQLTEVFSSQPNRSRQLASITLIHLIVAQNAALIVRQARR